MCKTEDVAVGPGDTDETCLMAWDGVLMMATLPTSGIDADWVINDACDVAMWTCSDSLGST